MRDEGTATVRSDDSPVSAGDEDVSAIRIDRDVDARHPSDLARVRARPRSRPCASQSYRGSFRRAATRPASTPDPSDFRVALDRRAGRLRRLRKPHRHAIRIGNPVARTERRRRARRRRPIPAQARAAPAASSHSTSTPRLRCSATFLRNVSTLEGVESRNR